MMVYIFVKLVVGVLSWELENIIFIYKVLEELYLMIKEIKLYVFILYFIMIKFLKCLVYKF